MTTKRQLRTAMFLACMTLAVSNCLRNLLARQPVSTCSLLNTKSVMDPQ